VPACILAQQQGGLTLVQNSSFISDNLDKEKDMLTYDARVHEAKSLATTDVDI